MLFASIFSYIEIQKETEQINYNTHFMDKNFNSVINKFEECSANEEPRSDNYLRETFKQLKNFNSLICNTTQEEFEKIVLSEMKDDNEIRVLVDDLSSIFMFSEYKYATSCYDYDKYKFLEKVSNNKVKDILNSKPLWYKYFYYCLKFINGIVFLPIILFSLFINFGFIQSSELLMGIF